MPAPDSDSVKTSRKASGSKIGGVLNALKRVSFTRRSSSDSIKDPKPPAPASQSTSTGRNPLGRTRSASSLAPSTVGSTVDTASVRPPLHRLNSSSPASELPKTWAEWTLAYRQGLIDFSDPPEPPSDLHATEYATPGGVFSAPIPENETQRQRAVDGIALLHQKKATKPRDLAVTTSTVPSGIGPALDANTTTKQRAEENGAFDPTELPTYQILEDLAKQAQERFSVETASVSLMDRDQQLFLAKRGFLPPGDVAVVTRQESCCSHTILKAASTGEKEPLVVLDFAKDWRFKTNSFGDHGEGFYAAAPILLPSALGDGEGNQAGGVFCVLGKSPRTSFSTEDRLDLEKMADKASKEIQKWAEQSRRDQKAELAKKRKTYKSQLARGASHNNSLDTVDEIPTPPLTPDLSKLDADADEGEFEPTEIGDPPRRPSLAGSAASSKSLDLKTTSTTPAFPKRRGRQGVVAQAVVPLPEEFQAVVDLSTQLVAESIEMDFSYVVAVDLASASSYDPESSNGPSPLRFVSVHGMPFPAPLLSLDLHLETLTSPHNALLYVNNDFTGIAGEFSTGLLVKVGTIGTTGYVLGTFTEDSRRVLNQEDLLFSRSFARDINRQLQPR
ncbi:hypothetical protein JCM11491_003060 [Sporobolomyces phaffii]